MGRCRVVEGERVRVPLSEGDYIDVKRDLNAGEYWDLLVALGERQKFAKILAYLLGWSLTGRDDHPIPYDVDDPEETRRDDHWRARQGDLSRTGRRPRPTRSGARTIPDQKKGDPACEWWRTRVRSDLNVCRAMGWTYDDVRALPRDVYTVLVDFLNQQATE